MINEQNELCSIHHILPASTTSSLLLSQQVSHITGLAQKFGIFSEVYIIQVHDFIMKATLIILFSTVGIILSEGKCYESLTKFINSISDSKTTLAPLDSQARPSPSMMVTSSLTKLRREKRMMQMLTAQSTTDWDHPVRR